MSVAYQAAEIVALAADRQSWVKAAGDALRAVADTAMGFATTVHGVVAAPTGTALAAYIPIVSPDESLQIGIVADDASARILVRALLQMTPTEELTDAVIVDAFGEVANMVAGMTKAAMSAWTGLVALGLPMVIHGWVAPSDGVVLDCLSARVGDATVTVVIARSRRSR